MPKHNIHPSGNDDEKVKDGDGSADQYIPCNDGDAGADAANSNEGHMSDATQDAMNRQRQQVIDYLSAHNRLNDAETEIGSNIIRPTPQMYPHQETEKEIPMSNASITHEKEMKAASTAMPPSEPISRSLDLSVQKEKQVLPASNASETIMRYTKQNEVDALEDRSTLASKAHQHVETRQYQQQHPPRIRGAWDEESDAVAPSMQSAAGNTSANRDGTPIAPTLAATATNDAASRIASHSTRIPHTTPTDLLRAQPRANHLAMRPGAIRIVQGVGGAHIERIDAMAASGTESDDAEASLITGINSGPTATSEYPSAVAATPIDEAFDGDDVQDIAELEEARRTGAEQARREILKDTVLADVAEDDQKSRKSIRAVVASICIAIVIGASVGAAVGSAARKGSSSSSSASIGPITATPTLASTEQPTASSDSPSFIPSSTPSALPSSYPSVVPSQSPTIRPTVTASSKPTTTDDILVSQKIDRVVRTVSDASHLANPSSYQVAALNWLLVQDDWITLQTEEKLVRERYALVLLTLMMSFDNWVNQYNFMDPTAPICEWGSDYNPISLIPALSCNDEQRVRSLSLVKHNLTGSIPSEIRFLDSLDTFDFGFNDLSGSLPSQLGELTKLEYFEIGSNRLTGTIPTEFGNLQTLRRIDIAQNRDLHGPIPTQMNTIRTLDYLMMDTTGLTNAETMCETGIVWGFFQADCRSESLTCTCCTICCLDGLGCVWNNK